MTLTVNRSASTLNLRGTSYSRRHTLSHRRLPDLVWSTEYPQTGHWTVHPRSTLIIESNPRSIEYR